MDENSCEGKTSNTVPEGQKTVESGNAVQLKDAGFRISLENSPVKNQVSDLCGFAHDASVSGPSTHLSPLINENNQIDTEDQKPEVEPKESIAAAVAEGSSSTFGRPTPPEERKMKFEPEPEPTPERVRGEQPPPAAAIGAAHATSPPPVYEDGREIQPRVRLAPGVEEELSSRRPSVGPPPSYSFVMKQKKKLKPPSSDPLVTDRPPPPPTYSGSRGLYVSPEENRLDRICNFPSFAEPIWRSHSQPALCPRCGIIVLTSTHSHDSVATHVAALALCLFGCWPCCLLPYCMNVCKNTYHHCPICQAYLGLYTPW